MKALRAEIMKVINDIVGEFNKTSICRHRLKVIIYKAAFWTIIFRNI